MANLGEEGAVKLPFLLLPCGMLPEDFATSVYRYKARCPNDDDKYPRRVRVYDGDTCRLDIDCGFSLVMERREIRLWGINAPELNDPVTKEAGIRVRDYLKSLILGRTDLFIETIKDATDSLGSRYLAKIYVPQRDGTLLFVNDDLVERFPGEVVPFMR
jgi:endonuclease YncB( thermonuclease family)